jgi:hypothetical protein
VFSHAGLNLESFGFPFSKLRPLTMANIRLSLIWLSHQLLQEKWLSCLSILSLCPLLVCTTSNVGIDLRAAEEILLLSVSHQSFFNYFLETSICTENQWNFYTIKIVFSFLSVQIGISAYLN